MAQGDIEKVADGIHYVRNERMVSATNPVKKVESVPLGSVGYIRHIPSTLSGFDYSFDFDID